MLECLNCKPPRVVGVRGSSAERTCNCKRVLSPHVYCMRCCANTACDGRRLELALHGQGGAARGCACGMLCAPRVCVARAVAARAATPAALAPRPGPWRRLSSVIRDLGPGGPARARWRARDDVLVVACAYVYRDVQVHVPVDIPSPYLAYGMRLRASLRIFENERSTTAHSAPRTSGARGFCAVGAAPRVPRVAP